MTSDPPDPPGRGWKVKEGGSVSVCSEGRWYRGISVRKNGPLFSIYLMDLGHCITVREAALRPLPDPLLDIHPLAYQVRQY